MSRSPAKKTQKLKHRACMACEQPLPDDHVQKMCMTCMRSVVGEDQARQSECFVDWFKNMMSQTFEEMRQATMSAEDVNRDDLIVIDQVSGESESGEISSSPSTSKEMKESIYLFSPDKIQKLIKAVNRVMEDQKKKKKQETSKDTLLFFSQQSEDTFPVNSIIKDLMQAEWKDPSKRADISKRFKQMFALHKQEISTWENPPAVDIPIARMSRRTTIPVEETSGLKDPMDRRADTALRRSYGAAAELSKPSIAAVSVSRTLKYWLNNLAEDIDSGVSRDDLLDAFKYITLAADFLCDTAVESVKLSARLMALSSVGRRALWMKAWKADLSSKNSLCSMGFEPGKLFGSKLDALIESLQGGKSKTLPQDRPRALKRNFFRYRSRSRSPRSKRPRLPFRNREFFRGSRRTRTTESGRDNKQRAKTKDTSSKKWEF
ncbi:uncharacterized protein LOC121400553 [Xenopus laevis]|uniref:Uncharacterized protein LOC121400553 n=1 Tax=Xenopus laevis TaxID=8355 RepID=A0A8J1ME39_XENLA|nr:uncharacterized protein LOC121400553 [Xenopus laevis]